MSIRSSIPSSVSFLYHKPLSTNKTKDAHELRSGGSTSGACVIVTVMAYNAGVLRFKARI
jgi:hypothetical protein